MTRREVVFVDVRSVARVGFAVSLALWGIVLVGVVALYLLGLVSGGLGGVEGFIASLGFTGFRFSILPFLLAFVVVGALASAAAAVGAGLVAHLYNAVRPLVGGVELVGPSRVAVPEPSPPRAVPEPSPAPREPQSPPVAPYGGPAPVERPPAPAPAPTPPPAAVTPPEPSPRPQAPSSEPRPEARPEPWPEPRPAAPPEHPRYRPPSGS